MTQTFSLFFYIREPVYKLYELYIKNGEYYLKSLISLKHGQYGWSNPVEITKTDFDAIELLVISDMFAFDTFSLVYNSQYVYNATDILAKLRTVQQQNTRIYAIPNTHKDMSKQRIADVQKILSQYIS